MPRKKRDSLSSEDGNNQNLPTIPSNETQALSVREVFQEKSIVESVLGNYKLTSIEEGEKVADLIIKLTKADEERLESEHKRQLENRQQNDTEKQTNKNLELAQQKQDAELSKAVFDGKLELEKLELEKAKEANKENDDQHRRNLETKEQGNLWQLTYLSFAIGIFLIIMGFPAGAIIASASLTIPTSSFILNKIKNRKKDNA